MTSPPTPGTFYGKRLRRGLMREVCERALAAVTSGPDEISRNLDALADAVDRLAKAGGPLP